MYVQNNGRNLLLRFKILCNQKSQTVSQLTFNFWDILCDVLNNQIYDSITKLLPTSAMSLSLCRIIVVLEEAGCWNCCGRRFFLFVSMTLSHTQLLIG